MLKRRASSPLPTSMSDVPIILDEKLHDPKRRRILPPVLDGQMRGWGTPQDKMYETFDEEDDGEEDIPDDEDPDATYNKHLDSPYKSANGFLHELHTLQRHRLLFSSQSAHEFSPNRRRDAPSVKDPASTRAPIHSSTSGGGEESSLLLATNSGKQQELNSVRNHYEEMNRWTFFTFESKQILIAFCRLLGSVVLSRRRELGPGVETNDI